MQLNMKYSTVKTHELTFTRQPKAASYKVDDCYRQFRTINSP